MLIERSFLDCGRRLLLKFIKPKNNNADNVDWIVSERVQAIVKTYVEYTQYSESEVVDLFLLNLLKDKDFLLN
ncbi:hypothetical protein F7731_11730 [Cytobacillus depressus]|uniref:Uncharacterized protein n=1 Tax=Cytobacillus depressus TaxID=1602942 RepID=A0A6L3V6S7_9BACI|nr:hypothetical protein [Cytobacillus depressus]KAB2336162.1 hypothetical protein F7731_11730 [Cytobacillus depressus]